METLSYDIVEILMFSSQLLLSSTMLSASLNDKLTVDELTLRITVSLKTSHNN